MDIKVIRSEKNMKQRWNGWPVNGRCPGFEENELEVLDPG